MKKIPTAIASLIAMAALGGPASADNSAMVTFRSLTLETVLDVTQAAMKKCRDDGFQVAVAVVDRGGLVQVALRDRFAGPHAPDTATRKAWTAVSFRTDTGELAQLSESGDAWAIRNVTSAKAGIAAIADKIAF